MQFVGTLESAGIRVSMDGRGRVFDNIFVEKLWRTVKYEEVYLHDYQTVPQARQGLATYFRFYNQERLHQALGYRTPHEVYHRARRGPRGQPTCRSLILGQSRSSSKPHEGEKTHYGENSGP